MAEPLRILLVDDSPEDRLLTVRELTREFRDLEIREAANPDAFASALDAGDYDLVITDYSLKWSDGLRVLEAVKARWPDLPVIMFTGTGNEEIAVRAMKAGLDDYVLKSRQHAIRLPVAVRASLERAESRRRARGIEIRLQGLLDQLNVGVFRSTLDGRILEANLAFLRILGFPNLESAVRADLNAIYLEPERRAALVGNLRQQGQVAEYAVRLRRTDGRVIWAALTETLVTGEPNGPFIDGLVEDITDRRQLEEQLLQAQKMESVGRLAGGIAHDFNNMLTAILSYGELIRQSLPQDHEAQEDLREVRRAAERAAALTGQLLAFSRRSIVEPKLVNLNELVVKMDGMLRPLIGEDIELSTVPGRGLRPVRADPAQLEQILLNLAVNARDAMPDGGKLTIETANVILDEEYTRQHPDVAPGEYVRLAVSDSGSGMSEEVKSKAFEPFFTTKEEGTGTGLGLATCYGIVKQAGGHIWVYSEPDQGTTFKVYFPSAEGEAETLEKLPEPERAEGTETVLVVEDEDVVRELAVRILRHHGYTVLEAPDGDVALGVVRAHDGELHLLLADAVLPGIRGRELAARVTEVRPGIRILFMSGYTDESIVRHGALEPGVAFLQKPFTPAALARRVREVLDA